MLVNKQNLVTIYGHCVEKTISNIFCSTDESQSFRFGTT